MILIQMDCHLNESPIGPTFDDSNVYSFDCFQHYMYASVV